MSEVYDAGADALVARVRTSIIRQYARPTRGDPDQPMRCTAGKAEHAEGLLAPQGKIIYDSQEQAQAAADAMHRLLSERQQFPHPCERSKYGHYHLTTQRRERGKSRSQRRRESR